MSNQIVAILLCFFFSALFTPIMVRLSFLVGAVDKPNYRKVHQNVKPRLGGLAIYFGTVLGVCYLELFSKSIMAVLIASSIIVIFGILDDIFTLTPIYKLLGQTLASLIVVFIADIKIEYIHLPFDIHLDFGIFSYIITIIWIIAITNAMNLIDGLDGLAGGISVIALCSMVYMAATQGNLLVISLSLVLIGSTVGFLIHNFYPSKIFMGDSGSQFLGFMLAIIAVVGLYKSVTIFSLLAPIIILGVPILDTLFAIMRRIYNKQNITAPDKSHLHHRLMQLGLSHPSAVYIIYLISIAFGIIAITVSRSTAWLGLAILFVLIFIIQIGAELLGLIGKRTFILNIIGKLKSLRRYKHY
ncbi:MraY family glycosyltransferase [Fredinandcohnia sp. QZ13]|uniref:glycosyltransferase family 4 protein n=1 Tax=Fredinandcohnia sp. QZ13 TaxID=3073144 RepID=UPI0028534E0D|nr:MraY family glycosyltransferase [Fredinandcohnia sp. QZ13]MDR4890019.1 MraY family glycosyltransferase [Fredinandcohnia sp. QZ13]